MRQMNILELKDKLEKMKVDKGSHSIYPLMNNESLCLEVLDQCWAIFYFERGGRFQEELYFDENSACIAFTDRLFKMLGLKS